MQRFAFKKLISWKNNPNRMPLIIDGARQVGKTWLMKEFGKTQYENTVYVNFDVEPSAKAFFASDLKPANIIRSLEYKAGFKIIPQKTLIMFDEIQECNRALGALKYFCEDAPQYHIISAGSLLGVAMHEGDSFPVGKVDRVELFPLSFAEFLLAVGETRYQRMLDDKAFNKFEIIDKDLTVLLKQYYFVGGMPRAVKIFVETKDYEKVRETQRTILRDYESDFSKHIDVPSIPKVGMIWDSLPSQLAKENKQFVYSDMKKGARAKEFESALYWLQKVGLIYKVSRIQTPSLPLDSYGKEQFKLYMLDVGLFSAKSGLALQTLAEPDPAVFNQFKGALTEQFVLQELKSCPFDSRIFYWANDKSKGTAEVDFLFQYNGTIIPLEVKAERNLQAKSLQTYIKYFAPKYAIRTSLGHYGKHGGIWDIPLYLIKNFASIIL
ncbi:MAG: ATP-binding protein [Endomicrobium sp.]|jgi:predicted AAA+ superfamily ATPase|uniref:ATP-binding protein n=1 Tax=Candidatus Endomicrobiellum cubanum TaxID=3242325 RepID=UPI00282896BD|nr:ATP-binding protein [Endomicrobium sp.]